VELTRLFNEAYRPYAGFVPRTSEYWRWNCLERPDVDKDGISVVIYGRQIVAYAVVGKSGNIWELCFNRAHDGKALLSLVLDRAVEYLTSAGSDAATLNLPCDDSVAREACEKAGFSELPPDPGVVFLSVLDFERLLSLLSSINEEKLRGIRGDFSVRFRDPGSWVRPPVSIRLHNGQTQIASESKHGDIVIETDSSTLTSILFGASNPLRAWLALKLKVYPLRKLGLVSKLLSLLRVDNTWFLPLSDLG